MERLSPKEVLIQIKKLRSLSYACISKNDGDPIDQAIGELNQEFIASNWEWSKKEGE